MRQVDAFGDSPHHHRGAQCARTACTQDANAQDQHGQGGCEWNQGCADGDHEAACDHDPHTAVAVREAAGNRLHDAPPQLADCKGQADRGDAQSGLGVQCAQKERQRLAASKRNRHQCPGTQHHRQPGEHGAASIGHESLYLQVLKQ